MAVHSGGPGDGFDSEPREFHHAAGLAAREVAGVGGLKQTRFIEQWETKLYAPAATATYNLKRLNNPGLAMQASGQRIIMQCPPGLENQDLPSSTESVSRKGNSWAAIFNILRSKAALRTGVPRALSVECRNARGEGYASIQSHRIN